MTNNEVAQQYGAQIHQTPNGKFYYSLNSWYIWKDPTRGWAVGTRVDDKRTPHPDKYRRFLHWALESCQESKNLTYKDMLDKLSKMSQKELQQNIAVCLVDEFHPISCIEQSDSTTCDVFDNDHWFLQVSNDRNRSNQHVENNWKLHNSRR